MGPQHQLTTTVGHESAIAQLALAQYGVFSRSQARSIGLSDDIVRGGISSGRFQRIHLGVYRISGSPYSWRQSLLAACLRAGDSAHASHRSAAALLGLAGFSPGILEISTRKNVRLKESRVIVHRIRDWPECDTTTIASIPVTEPVRTLIDLAAVASVEDLEVALDDALRRRLITLPRLLWRLKTIGVHGKPGASWLTALVKERRQELVLPESWLERKVIRFLARGGFPPPIRQFQVFDGQRFVGRVDLSYPGRKLVIEADGYEFHSDPNAWERDRARDNDLECLGWRVIRVTWKQVTKHPDALNDLLNRFLGGP